MTKIFLILMLLSNVTQPSSWLSNTFNYFTSRNQPVKEIVATQSESDAQQLSPTMLQQINLATLQQMNPDFFSWLTLAQFQTLPDDIFSEISFNHLKNLQPEKLNALSKEKFKKLHKTITNSELSNFAEIAKKLNHPQRFNLIEQANLNDQQIKNLLDFYPTIKSLPGETVDALLKKYINPTYSKFQADLLNILKNSNIRLIPVEIMQSLHPDEFNILLDGDTSNASNFTLEQIKNFTPIMILALQKKPMPLSGSYLSQFNQRQIQAIPSDLLKYLSTDELYDIYQALTEVQRNNLPVEAKQEIDAKFRHDQNYSEARFQEEQRETQKSPVLLESPRSRALQMLGFKKEEILSGTITKEQISRHYKDLALKYHPDKHVTKNPDEKIMAEAKFKEIQAAHDTLIQ